jgi:hypothetical protein
MTRRIRLTSTVLTLLFVLLFSAVHPLAAYADNGTPVAPDPSTTATNPPAPTNPTTAASPAVSTDTTVPATQAPAATYTTVAPTNSAPATPAPPSSTTTNPASGSTNAFATATATAVTSTTSADLSQVPTGTSVVVVNNAGTVLPLATQQAANIIANGDPIWCPAGTSPVASTGGCTSTQTDLASLITLLSGAQPNQAGTIWITVSIDSSDPNNIDGSSLNTMANYALTLQGGWNGLSNGGISGTSTFTKAISITNWNADVTVNDISIANPSTAGLTVKTKKNIHLHNVTLQNNNGNGATLDNTAGNGNVTVDGTNTFNNNAGNGLQVDSKGLISLNNLSADNNSVDGVALRNNSGSGDVSLTGTNEFSNNSFYGLVIYASHNISLSGVTADVNGDTGAYLDNTYATGHDVTVDSSSFSNNINLDGLDILSKGNISLSSVTADGNGGSGALLVNTYATGYDVMVDPSSFSNNHADGLDVYSAGNITLSGVSADKNYDYGAYLDNSYANADLSVSGSNFDSNTHTGRQTGLDVNSNGNITLNSVSASNNLHGDGSDIDFNSGSFSSLIVQNSIFNNNFSTKTSWGYGLYIDNGLGDVTINNIQTSGNSSSGSSFTDGTYINTTGSVIANSSQFNNNTSGDGLDVSADGNITITCSTFQNNSSYGVDATLSGGTLTMNSDTFSGNGNGDFTNSGGATLLGSVNCSPKNSKGVVNGLSLPLQVVNVTAGQSASLDCTNFRGTELILSDGDSLTLLCPLLGDASLTSLKSNGLPGALPAGDTFTSAFTASLSKGGKPAMDLGNSATVSFAIPAGASGKSFAILFLNGTQFTEIPSTLSLDGHVLAAVNHPGTYVLVQK